MSPASPTLAKTDAAALRAEPLRRWSPLLTLSSALVISLLLWTGIVLAVDWIGKASQAFLSGG